MSKIHIYKGDFDKDVFSAIRAELSFSGSSSDFGAANVKLFTADEARRGLEQLKRWVSTGAFKAIAITGLSEALEKGDKAHLIEWLQDHSTEPDFPQLVLLGESQDKIEGLSTDIVDAGGVRKILTT